MYSYIISPRGSSNTSTHYIPILHGITSLGSNPRLPASAALAPPPGRSISTGGSALVGCATDPSDPLHRRGQPTTAGHTSPIAVRIRRECRRLRRPYRASGLAPPSTPPPLPLSTILLHLSASARLQRTVGTLSRPPLHWGRPTAVQRPSLAGPAAPPAAVVGAAGAAAWPHRLMSLSPGCGASPGLLHPAPPSRCSSATLAGCRAVGASPHLATPLLLGRWTAGSSCPDFYSPLSVLNLEEIREGMGHY